jgi:hypothetical protein
MQARATGKGRHGRYALCTASGTCGAPQRLIAKRKGHVRRAIALGSLSPTVSAPSREGASRWGIASYHHSGPLGHEPLLRWWRCAYHRLMASIPPGSGAPDGHSGWPFLAQFASLTAPKNRLGRYMVTIGSKPGGLVYPLPGSKASLLYTS